MTARLIAIALVLIMSNSVYAYNESALVPVTEKLSETTTEHFHIIFQNSLRSAVGYLAAQCEEAYAALTPIFGWYPQKRIEVLFVDSFDTHNGWATCVPHNKMAIYASGAEPGSSIFQPGNYLKRTVYHELTHVLSMDMRYGYSRVFSGIFGKMLPVGGDLLSSILFYFSLSPVALTPTWYLEGIAIWAETEFAPPGRGRASIPDMIFRSAVCENNMLPYSCWDLDIPYWPYGLGAYLYGMKLVEYGYEHSQTDEPVGKITQDIAHAFMFNFDRRSVPATGKRFGQLMQEMFKNEKTAQRNNIEQLKELPLTAVPRLTRPDIICYQPLFVGDSIYFAASEEDTRNTLYLYDPDQKKTEKIARARTTAAFGSLSVSSDSRFVYYTRLDVQHKDEYRYEVRRFDTERRKDTIVTAEGRYRAIDISPDGRNMTAVSMRAGKSLLVQVPLDGAGDPEKEEILAHAPFQDNLSSPRYSPDSARITYVRGDESGFALCIFDLKEHKESILYKTKRQILFPAWHSGKESILFSSDENGVFNLYEIPSNGSSRPTPLTHVVGGVFSPCISADGSKIAAVAYDSKGYYLTLISHDPETLADKDLPCIHSTWKAKDRKENHNETTRSLSVTDTEPYSSVANTRFDYWGPWLTASSEGVQGGIGAHFSDPTGYQNLHLLAGIESEYDTPVWFATYTYKGFYPVFSLYASQYQGVYPDLIKTEEPGETTYDYVEEVKKFGLAADIPFIRLDRSFSLTLGYQFVERDFVEKSDRDYNRKEITTTDLSEKDEGAIWARLTYFDGTAFKRSNSVEDGRLICVTTEKSDTCLGGSLSRWRTLADWFEYISNPWVKNHVFKLTGTYGFGHGDRTAQGMFGLGGFGNTMSSESPGLQRSILFRGYQSNFQTGERIAKLSCAYRFPIVHRWKGGGSAPFFAKQLFAEVFYETGRTWDDEGQGDNLGWIDAAGLEVNFSMKLLRFLDIAPGLGFAYAPDRPKGSDDDLDERYQLYISIKGSVNF